MSLLAPPAQVGDEEPLARYVFSADHVRKTDQSVKPDAFIPHPHLDLSVTRHLGLAEDQIWAHGKVVSAQRQRPLIGRADVTAATFRREGLQPSSAPVTTNAHHVNVVGWPVGKPAQKIIAQEVAARARYLPLPAV